MRTASIALLLAASRAFAGDPPTTKSDCTVHVGPNDRIAQDGNLVVPEGAQVASAVAIHGDVVVLSGARVDKAAAIRGNVEVRSGATVREDAIAIGGDVKLADGARVGKNVLALGGQVRRSPRSAVGGNVLALTLQLGDGSLQAKILSELEAQGHCQIERESADPTTK
jgi:NDP-sugar pyrophosphorylase family protein